MAGTFGCDHSDIYIGGRHDLRVVQAEAVRRHQHLTGCQGRPNIALKYLAMMLIRDKNHDYISLLRGISGREHAQAIGLGLLAALAGGGKADHYIAATIAHVQRMSMTLAAIADHGDTFLLNTLKICICIVIDICHILSLLGRAYQSRPYNGCGDAGLSIAPLHFYDCERLKIGSTMMCAHHLMLRRFRASALRGQSGQSHECHILATSSPASRSSLRCRSPLR